MKAPDAAFYTFGCKLNQCETEEIAASFRERGYIVAMEDGEAEPKKSASAVVVNTCTVTSKAEQKARRLIRRLLEAEGVQKVFVTGCYARLNREDIEKLEAGVRGRGGVGGGGAACGGGACGVSAKLSVISKRELLAHSSSFSMPLLHSRAYLKIQDGCNNACTYCRIRLARGRERSVHHEFLAKKLLSFEEAGIAEAMLAGVNISQYKSEKMNLAGLLEYLLSRTKSIAIRLSSLESSVFSPPFYEALKNPRIRPHFHISMQSASPVVLRKMGRNDNAAFLLEAVARLRSIRFDPFLACDIIAGFPGETEEDALATYNFCEKADFAWIHAFPFSPRPGTPAAGFDKQVSAILSKRRVERLLHLAKKSKLRYIERWTGAEIEAVAEGGGIATSANYLKLKLNPCRGSGRRDYVKGAALRCKILPLEEREQALKIDAVGEIVETKDRRFNCANDDSCAVCSDAASVSGGLSCSSRHT